MQLKSLFYNLSQELIPIEQAILADIETSIPRLNEVSHHILRSGGKRVRPALVWLSAQCFGMQDRSVIQAAQVVEYLHTATLLHDDVVDQAELRRSQEAARQIWGNESSVFAGNYLFAKAFHMLTELGHLDILQMVSQATTLMAQGELLQLVRAYENPSEREYFDIIFNKTASLFAAAVKMGAILGGATTEQQEQLYEYGKKVGLAFQVVDDALDYMEEEANTGKAVGIDLKERKITLPLIHLLQQSTPAEQQRIHEILNEDTIEDTHVQEVIQLMKAHQTRSYVLDVAQRYVNEAKTHLQCLNPSSAKEQLEAIAEFIVARRT